RLAQRGLRLPWRPGGHPAPRRGHGAPPCPASSDTDPRQSRVRLPASVEGRERLRLFCALRLPDGALDTLQDWQAARLAAVVPLPLASRAHPPPRGLPGIAGPRREPAGAAEPIRLQPERYRETRSVGMVVLNDLAGSATRLAEDLFARLEGLGVYERERRPWLPHVTVLRFRRPPPLKPPPPALREVGPSDPGLCRF